MLPLNQSSACPYTNRPRDRMRCRPFLESLEPRLPPGDALLGLLVGWSLLGLDSYDREFLSRSDVQLASTPMFAAATDTDAAELSALGELPGGHAHSEFIVRRRIADGTEGLVKSEPNDLLEHSHGSRAFVTRPQSFSTTTLEVASLPMLTGRAESMHPSNPQSIPSGFAAVGRLMQPPSVMPTTSSRGAEGYGSLPFYFEKNVGQAGEGLDYVARGPGYTLGLTATEAVMSIPALSEP